MTLCINVMKTLKFIVRKNTQYIIYIAKYFKHPFTKHKKLVEWHLSTQQVALNGSLLQSHYQHSVPSGYLNAENFKLKSNHVIIKI